MPTNLRTLGVGGKNKKSKKTLTVKASDFNIAGLLINCERKYDKAYEVSSPEEFQEIFGDHILSTNYGGDAVKGFFDNIIGVTGKLWVQSVMGYDVSTDTVDEVNAYTEVEDAGADSDALTINAAYENELEYGTSGNRTAIKITNVDRFATEAAATVAATGVSLATLDSVSGIKVGDLICFKTGVGGADLVYKIVTAVDENAKTVAWTGDFQNPAGGETLSIDDDVVIPGFRIQTYRKSITGVETEVDVELGKKICSTESAVTDFFVDNVFQSSKWIKCTYASASTLSDRIIPNSANPVYLTSGAAGTAIATTEAMDYWLSKFNSKPIRMLCYPESTSQTYQDRLLVYSNSRDDNPIIIITIAEDRTESQLKQIGQNYQKSDYQPGIIVANWLEKDDPFSNSVLAPDRTCPPGGHVMGAWIRCIQQNGIHCIPATDDIPIYGVKGVKGDFFEDDNDRTEIAEAGVNLIQEKQGVGIKIANFFTVSTATEYLFGNGILMRNYLKISAEDSLAKTENTPNVYNRITASRMALLTFMYTLWKRGSNGDVSEGETFGQSFNEDGTKTKATDHFEVTADLTNNPQSAINLGQRDIDIYFSYPSPAGSIFIGVGILLR